APAEADSPSAGSATQAAETDASLRLADARSGSATRAAEAETGSAPRGTTAVAVFGDLSVPLTVVQSVWNGTAPRHIPAPEKAPSRFRPGWPQAIGGLLGLAALGLLAVSGVFLVRAFLSTPFMQDFLTTYPGEYHVDVAPGFAPWVGWQHFFNMFLMVLIIRSGLRVRTEKRPTAFWTPRGKAKGKISLTLWFHQSLDLLWMVNGVIFVVLLFSTGHWLRLVPTSWEVFPNALSAGLQYVSFDWPTDNGWVNYNSLQQLAYFTTVFLAAPLAAITGFRMSGLWPKKAEKLSAAYPIEWARALHFPTMLYFVAFIIVHVALVFLTGALRNLNHMFAGQGSVDGMEYAANWTGFGVFVLAILVIAGAWFAARPLVLAPIAKLFGQVSGR
ncbi:cytochrome b/b6 domain-containing protein, partial [Microbacterium sp.]|uniref:cytochrome b/b6 domain-containing protein n=1 Tax=Microbacterium sp. TaxID=51671 RepID=UPI003C7743A1